jgi:catecholate siderophore receptor
VRYERFDLDSVDIADNTTGARVDERWNPRFGVIVKRNEALSLYASYTECFLPQAGDQFSLVAPQEELRDPEIFVT